VSGDNIATLTAADIVRILDLAPHPEGGFYRENFRDGAQTPEGRAASTLIYFLLPFGAVSAWHRVDAVEVWHFYAGAPLVLSLCGEDGRRRDHILGPDLLADEKPQCVVPAGVWQMATHRVPNEAHSAQLPWSLVGCTVAPGFSFSGFELAPADWQPSGNYTAS
jgi:uncharacterized protein